MNIKSVKGIVKCKICGKPCKGSSGLGGHMSKHNNANKEARKEKNRLRMQKVRRLRRAKPRPAPRSTLQEIAAKLTMTAPPKRGSTVPFQPFQLPQPRSIQALHPAAQVALQMRQAARDHRAKADELDKMAQRAEQLM